MLVISANVAQLILSNDKILGSGMILREKTILIIPNSIV
jgi:hypothetical protein